MGDKVSLEIVAPDRQKLEDSQLQVLVTQPVSQSLATAKFAHFGLGKRMEADLTWVWDTAGLSPGAYTLGFNVLPFGASWRQTVTLQPDGARPPGEVGARWVTDESDCCLVYTISHTAAERDKADLLEILDEQAVEISRKMDADFKDSVTITFIPRVLGHGGFTSQEISVSYLDRNYTGDATEMILRHELTHLLDSRLGGDLRPIMFVEGLAVYISGGHFKPEPILLRAAVLLKNGQYIPLRKLVDDFYNTQHEIGYMEAGALVEFMVDTWGWEGFSAFYRDIHPAPDNGSQSAAIDIALKKHFNQSLYDLELSFMDALRSQQELPELAEDVNLTVDFYNTIRRYQQALDPSAYFLTAWILDGKEMRQRGITADYLRHPATHENLALETMLQAAGEDLRSAHYSEAQELIASINQVLEAVEKGQDKPLSSSPLAAEYDAIVRLLMEQNFQPQRIRIDGIHAQAWATSSGVQLQEFQFSKIGKEWSME